MALADDDDDWENLFADHDAVRAVATAKNKKPTKQQQREKQHQPQKHQSLNQSLNTTISVMPRYSGVDYSREPSPEQRVLLRRMGNRNIGRGSSASSSSQGSYTGGGADSAPPRRPDSIEALLAPQYAVAAAAHGNKSGASSATSAAPSLSVSAQPVIVRRTKRNRSTATDSSAGDSSGRQEEPQQSNVATQGKKGTLVNLNNKGRRVLTRNAEDDGELGVSGFLGVEPSSASRARKHRQLEDEHEESQNPLSRGSSAASSMAGNWTARAQGASSNAKRSNNNNKVPPLSDMAGLQIESRYNNNSAGGSSYPSNLASASFPEPQAVYAGHAGAPRPRAKKQGQQPHQYFHHFPSSLGANAADENNVLPAVMEQDFDPLGKRLHAITERYRQQDIKEAAGSVPHGAVVPYYAAPGGEGDVGSNGGGALLHGSFFFSPAMSVIGTFRSAMTTRVQVLPSLSNRGFVLQWEQRSPKGGFKSFAIPLENIRSVDAENVYAEDEGIASSQSSLIIEIHGMKLAKVIFGFQANWAAANKAKTTLGMLIN